MRSGSPTSPSTRGSHDRSPGPLQIWIIASRFPTLPAAIVPLLVGRRDRRWPCSSSFTSGVDCCRARSASLLIQIGTNFANDLFDFKRGADTEERTVPCGRDGGVSDAEADGPGHRHRLGAGFLVGVYLVYLRGWPVLASAWPPSCAAFCIRPGRRRWRTRGLRRRVYLSFSAS